MEKKFVCPKCGNKDPKYIGYLNGNPYCRRCIVFNGKIVEHESYKITKKGHYYLPYKLSKEQTIISNNLIKNFKEKVNSYVYAVCGSGKTEIVFDIISYCINNKLKVGYTVPRRDVAVELYERFNEVFSNNKVTCIYGGHNEDLYGDLVCLTTHQLFRYKNYFDLLICDEVDAFPFKGDFVLNSLFFAAISGNYILLSATPKKSDLIKFEKDGGRVLKLFSRFHGHPLPVPEIILKNFLQIYFVLIKIINEFIMKGKQVFIFTPTIEICESVFSRIKMFCKKGNYVHSKCIDRAKRIKDFRDKKYMYLVTTAVLERGVTVKDLQVIVFNANHRIYDAPSLVQIAGRVGRKKDAPDGKVYFLANEKSKDMEEAINTIMESNKHL